MSMNFEHHVRLACAQHHLAWGELSGDALTLVYEGSAHALPAETARAAWAQSGASGVRAWVAGASAAIRVGTAPGLTFGAVAAGLVMRLVNAHTLAGQRAVTGRDQFALPFAAGLLLACYVDADGGLAPLSAARVESWGATVDRVTSAARSNLYHRTPPEPARRAREPAPHERVECGDSLDSGRVALLSDLWWDRVFGGIAFAAPGADLLLLAPAGDEAGVCAIAQAAAAHYAEAAFPVSPEVFVQRGRQIEPRVA
jgi:hypothetical protein